MSTTSLLQPTLLLHSKLNKLLYIYATWDYYSTKHTTTYVRQPISLLNLIHTKIEYNNSLYVLSHIRSIDCICNLENIEILIIVLDRRCNYLFTTLDIFKKYKTNGISSYL